jgi:hypothetical protein
VNPGEARAERRAGPRKGLPAKARSPLATRYWMNLGQVNCTVFVLFGTGGS